MRYLLLFAGLLSIAGLTPSTSAACTGCSHDSVSESLLDATFVQFDAGRRLLTYRAGARSS